MTSYSKYNLATFFFTQQDPPILTLSSTWATSIDFIDLPALILLFLLWLPVTDNSAGPSPWMLCVSYLTSCLGSPLRRCSKWPQLAQGRAAPSPGLAESQATLWPTVLSRPLTIDSQMSTFRGARRFVRILISFLSHGLATEHSIIS